MNVGTIFVFIAHHCACPHIVSGEIFCEELGFRAECVVFSVSVCPDSSVGCEKYWTEKKISFYKHFICVFKFGLNLFFMHFPCFTLHILGGFLSLCCRCCCSMLQTWRPAPWTPRPTQIWWDTGPSAAFLSWLCPLDRTGWYLHRPLRLKSLHPARLKTEPRTSPRRSLRSHR